MPIVNLKKSLEVFRAFRPSLHRQKIDDLNKQQRLAATRFLHHIHQLLQPRDKPVIAYTQKRTARNITHASRLDDEHCRPPFSKARVPIEVLLRDKPVFSRAPGHHRRHPRAASRLESSDFYRCVKKGSRSLFGSWPLSFFDSMSDWVRKLPHVRAITVARSTD